MVFEADFECAFYSSIPVNGLDGYDHRCAWIDSDTFLLNAKLRQCVLFGTDFLELQHDRVQAHGFYKKKDEFQ